MQRSNNQNQQPYGTGSSTSTTGYGYNHFPAATYYAQPQPASYITPPQPYFPYQQQLPQQQLLLPQQIQLQQHHALQQGYIPQPIQQTSSTYQTIGYDYHQPSATNTTTSILSLEQLQQSMMHNNVSSTMNAVADQLVVIDDNFILTVKERAPDTLQRLRALKGDKSDIIKNLSQIKDDELKNYINYINNFKTNDPDIFNLFIYFYTTINTSLNQTEAAEKAGYKKSTFTGHIKSFANITYDMLKNCQALKAQLEAAFPGLKKAIQSMMHNNESSTMNVVADQLVVIDDNFILTVKERAPDTVKRLLALKGNKSDIIKDKSQIKDDELKNYINYINNFKTHDPDIFNLFIYFYTAINTSLNLIKAAEKIGYRKSTFTHQIKFFGNIRYRVLKECQALKAQLEAAFPELKEAIKRYSGPTFPSPVEVIATPLPSSSIPHTQLHREYTLQQDYIPQPTQQTSSTYQTIEYDYHQPATTNKTTNILSHEQLRQSMMHNNAPSSMNVTTSNVASKKRIRQSDSQSNSNTQSNSNKRQRTEMNESAVTDSHPTMEIQLDTQAFTQSSQSEINKEKETDQFSKLQNDIAINSTMQNNTLTTTATTTTTSAETTTSPYHITTIPGHVPFDNDDTSMQQSDDPFGFDAFLANHQYDEDVQKFSQFESEETGFTDRDSDTVMPSPYATSFSPRFFATEYNAEKPPTPPNIEMLGNNRSTLFGGNQQQVNNDNFFDTLNLDDDFTNDNFFDTVFDM